LNGLESSQPQGVAFAEAAHAAFWAGDLDAARVALASLDALGLHGRGIALTRTMLGAGIAALEARWEDAGRLYREALAGWPDLGQVWEEALIAIDMATLLDPADPEVVEAARRARETLERLRAAPFVARLDAALARPPAAPPGVRPLGVRPPGAA
jgi:hypothetical protein